MKRDVLLVIVAAAAVIILTSGNANSTPSHAVPANPHATPGHIYARPVPVEIPGEGERVRIEYKHGALKDYEAKFKRGYDACRSSGLPQANSKYCANTAHLWW